MNPLELMRDVIKDHTPKSITGRLTAVQKEWRHALEKTGNEYYLWRPRQLDYIADVLSRTEPPGTVPKGCTLS